MNRPLAADSTWKALLCVATGLLLLTLSDTIVRWVSARLPLHEMMTLRGLFAISTILVLARVTRWFGVLSINQPGLLVLRAVLMAAVNTSFFLALITLPYAYAMALFFTSPLIITALAAVVLREPVGLVRWAAVGTGLVGVVVILDPAMEQPTRWAGLALLAAVLYAAVQVLNRGTRAQHGPGVSALAGHIGIFTVSVCAGLVLGGGRYAADSPDALGAAFFGAWVRPELGDFLLLAAAGCIAATAMCLLFQSYRLAPASSVAPFEYLALLYATISGYLLWGEVPTLRTGAGIALIVGAGMIAIFRTHARQQR